MIAQEFLGKICDIKTGKLDVNAESSNGKYPFFTCAEKPVKIDFYDYDCECVLIAGNGEFAVNYYKGKFNAYQRTYIVTAKKKLTDEVYLPYLYSILKRAILDLKTQSQGSIIQYLRLPQLETLEIPFPKPDEQKRIAAILDKADRLRRGRRFAQTLADSFLQSVFIKMFGEQLAEDFPKTELIKLAKITGGGTPSRAIEEYFTGKIAWLTSKDMRGDYIFDTKEHITEEAIKNSATKLVPKGSILMVVKSKVLMNRLPLAVSQIPICHGQDIKSIQCSKKVNSLFLLYVLKYNEKKLLQLARGANTEGLTLPMIESVPVPNAPLPLQEKFASIVQKFERVRRQQREATRQAEHLFQTLLHRAFRGEL